MSLLALIIGAMIEHTGTSLADAAEGAEEDFTMLCKCVEAEAGTQDLTGKRLVADVILNRVESNLWPNTIKGVITQDRQFMVYPSPMNKTTPSQETIEACMMESGERVDTEIIYFTSCGYISKPAYKHGNHYFSY